MCLEIVAKDHLMIKFSVLIQFSGESIYLQSVCNLVFLVLFPKCNLSFP